MKSGTTSALTVVCVCAALADKAAAQPSSHHALSPVTHGPGRHARRAASDSTGILFATRTRFIEASPSALASNSIRSADQQVCTNQETLTMLSQPSARSVLHRVPFRSILAATAAVLGLGTPAMAGDITITPADNLQAAINTSANGDTIRFSPGTYNQIAIIDGKSLTLEGIAGAEVTILTANALNNTVLRVINAPAPGVTIRGLTVRDGTAPGTAGSPDGYPNDGGGISASNSPLTIEDCRFIGNQAGDDGGAIYTLAGGATITDTLFDSNSSTAGGALLIRGASAVDGCTFTNNTGDSAAGAIYFLGGSSGNISNSMFRMNQSPAGQGGAVFTATVLGLSFTNCEFTQNMATTTGGAISAGDLASAGTITLRGCSFTKNTAFGAGGDGGAVYAGINASLDIAETTFTRNGCPDNGGGIYKTGAGALTLGRSGFFGNVALRGGGLRSNTTSNLSNCAFVGNTASASGFGGGLYVGGTPFNVINSSFVGNQGAEPSIGSTVASVFKNCIVRGNAANPAINAVHAFTYSNVEQTGIRAGVGNINASSNFAGTPSAGLDATWGTDDDQYGDLQLLAGSPDIDAGDSPAALSLPLDLPGQNRNQDDPATPNTGLSAWALNVDMGAYEFQPAPPQPACPADFNNSGGVSVQDIFDFLAAYFAGCP
ncbi:MAG: hypothetical protein IT438_06630 [Phycisphaerales bacterium]|nr:hypothetical protein [Phycisphaerales bacterium]